MECLRRSLEGMTVKRAESFVDTEPFAKRTSVAAYGRREGTGGSFY